ncbi:hypothetical protein D3C78_1192930 [compost metagenome]
MLGAVRHSRIRHLPVNAGNLCTNRHIEHRIEAFMCSIADDAQMILKHALIPVQEILAVSSVIAAACIKAVAIGWRVNLAYIRKTGSPSRVNAAQGAVLRDHRVTESLLG